MNRTPPPSTADLKRMWIQHAADVALRRGKIIRIDALGLDVVPDTIVVEKVANGAEPPPDTYRLLRDDGRMVWLYAMPRSAA